MREISCATCHLDLGWCIDRAHEKGEEWKNGKYLLELSHLVATTERRKRMGRTSDVMFEEDEDAEGSD